MPTLSTVTVGTRLDERTHEPSMVSLFLYNAAIWNPHRIHFDADYTTQIENHPGIEQVFYPGLESHPDHAIAREQMSGFGGVISYRVKGSLEDVSRFIDACNIPKIGPSLGGVESLI